MTSSPVASRVTPIPSWVAGSATAAFLALAACSAGTPGTDAFSGPSGGSEGEGGSGGSGPAGTGGSAAAGPSSASTGSGDGGSAGAGGQGGAPQGPTSTGPGPVTATGTGGDDSSSSGYINPCGTECSNVEICDGISRGLDDDCDGEVDEGCPCRPGEFSDCFKGDPSFREEPGCFPGTMKCGADGTWNECNGGSHAWGPNPCTVPSETGCGPISAVPFQIVDLITGTGTFSANADAGSQLWEVECPPGVDPCPAVNGANPADDFQPLQSGEYTVSYSKTVAGQPLSCTYPLYVGARGLRVELTWEFGSGTDLDLHMGQPGVSTSFNSGGSSTDCTWNNCRYSSYGQFGSGPEWFPETAPLGDPIAWYLDPDPNLNSCYFAPRGVGAAWEALDRGCHNPRLDLDNVSCNVGETDPDGSSFCAPENTNIDFPPLDGWTRLAVVHYSGSTNQPTLRVFCDGALRAELGPGGFDAPVQLSGGSPKQVWLAADVRYTEGECSRECEVIPIYRDAGLQTSWIDTVPSTTPPFPP